MIQADPVRVRSSGQPVCTRLTDCQLQCNLACVEFVWIQIVRCKNDGDTISCPHTMLCRQLHMFLLSLLADKRLWPWVDGSINRSICIAFFTRENKIHNFNIVHLIQHQVEASSSLSETTRFAVLLHKWRSRFTFRDRMPIVSNTSDVFCFAGRGTPQLGYPVL